MDDFAYREKLSVLNNVFTPASPIISKDFFFGRIDCLQQVVDTIMERGQHAILYGDRGVGKTSLANILNDSLQGMVIAKVTCNRTEDFKSIWEKLFKKIILMAKTQGYGFTAQEAEKAVQMNLFLPPEQKVDPADILSVLESLSTPVLFIFDEFDSVQDNETRVRFADTIKALSDNAPHVTVLLVGVAQTISELLGSHPSNERCIKQIHLPRMSAEELKLILENGLKKLGMSIDPLVELDIVEFSQGFPHYTHLLSKYAAKSALGNRSLTITRQDFDLGIDEALANVHESVRDLYQRAVLSGHKDSLFADVVHACSIVKEDEHGTFRATDVQRPLVQVTGKHFAVSAFGYHLARLSNLERGPLLAQVGRGKMHQYRFMHPLLRAYIRIKLYQKGLIEGQS